MTTTLTPPSPVSARTARLGEIPTHTGIILALACLAQFMVVLDVSVVNVALPSIRTDLGYSATGLQWVVNAYALTFAGFLLLGGRLADLFGRRRVFVFALGLFTVASLACGAAHTDTMLTIARGVQGLGGAVLAPVTLTIVMTTFTEGAARHKALGIWSSMAAAGGASGGILGGALTDYASWRWVFFINAPIGILGILIALRFLPESGHGMTRQRLDVAGALTVTAGLASIVYGIVGTESHAWSSSYTLGWIGAGLVLVAAFLVIEARVAVAPLMPLRLWRSRARSSANLVMLLIGGAFFSMWFFLSLYVQNVMGYSPIRTGVAFLPMTAAIITGALVSARLVTRFGPRMPLVVGCMIAGGAFVWLGQIEAGDHFVSHILPQSFLLALGLGLSMTPLATAATDGVAPHEAGLASGLLNTSRQMGGSLGLALLATLATTHTAALLAAGHASPGQALSAGFARGFVYAGVLCIAAAIVGLLLPGSAATHELPVENVTDVV